MNTRKKIGLDMRMAGEGFGIGKYVIELATALIKRDSEFEYVLFFDKNFNQHIQKKYFSRHPHIRFTTAKYYSWSEQTVFLSELHREKLDLVHFPNFNAPILYPGKFVITIHDLIHHHFPGKKKLNLVYRWGYRLAINLAARRANRIIAVSETSANDIIKTLEIPRKKISVVYNGISPLFRPNSEPERAEKIRQKYGIGKKYFLWVGVWRRYKNLPFLSQGYELFRKSSDTDVQLVLVGEMDKNYPGVRDQVFENAFKKDIIETGKVEEADLPSLYNNALAYISPSLLEGFNLSALEAQACGTQVLSSDIPVAKEIFGSSATFFDPTDVRSLADALAATLNPQIASRRVEEGLNNAGRFTWNKTAEMVEDIYKRTLGLI